MATKDVRYGEGSLAVVSLCKPGSASMHVPAAALSA